MQYAFFDSPWCRTTAWLNNLSVHNSATNPLRSVCGSVVAVRSSLSALSLWVLLTIQNWLTMQTKCEKCLYKFCEPLYVLLRAHKFNNSQVWRHIWTLDQLECLSDKSSTLIFDSRLGDLQSDTNESVNSVNSWFQRCSDPNQIEVMKNIILQTSSNLKWQIWHFAHRRITALMLSFM